MFRFVLPLKMSYKIHDLCNLVFYYNDYPCTVEPLLINTSEQWPHVNTISPKYIYFLLFWNTFCNIDFKMFCNPDGCYRKQVWVYLKTIFKLMLKIKNISVTFNLADLKLYGSVYKNQINFFKLVVKIWPEVLYCKRFNYR